MMDLKFDLGRVVGWRHPDGERRFFGRVIRVDFVSQTVDMLFEDGSERGKIPVSELEAVPPDVTDPISDIMNIDVIRPRGIESEEGLGRF